MCISYKILSFSLSLLCTKFSVESCHSFWFNNLLFSRIWRSLSFLQLALCFCKHLWISSFSRFVDVWDIDSVRNLISWFFFFSKCLFDVFISWSVTATYCQCDYKDEDTYDPKHNGKQYNYFVSMLAIFSYQFFKLRSVRLQ